MLKNPFVALTKQELRQLYEARAAGREEGLRPKSFDPFIKKVMETYPLTFGEAWRHSDELFMEEVARRYFENN